MGGGKTPRIDGAHYSERADLEPQSDNLLILGESGDVLEALTRVPELADKYLGKIKCVYIDPPFNTAQTFAHYEDNLEHSVWLTMMRDRLIHLRELLSDDGSIWVHLDDVENHRMRVLMDEVFGSGNFVAEVGWERTRTGGKDAKEFFAVEDRVIVYKKDIFFPNFAPPQGDIDYPYIDEHGPYRAPLTLRKTGSNWRRQDRPNMWYPITAPDGTEVWPLDSRGREGRWRWSKQKTENCLDIIHWKKTGGRWMPYTKYYKSEEKVYPYKNLWTLNDVGGNFHATDELKLLFPDDTSFDTPKPERLLERIIHIATNPGDIVLDVFAGSGTTAAVAQKMGRRWVTCELVEDTFTRFTLPRLEKVIRGEDMGGISTTKGERVDATCDGLPEGMTPDEGQKLTSLLNKALRGHDELKKDPAIKTIKRLVKTKNSGDIINWRGGGGFTVAHLAPPCYTYDLKVGHTTLTDAAIGDTLVASVAANLGFHLTKDDPHFDGRRGNEHLAVIEGVLTEKKVDDLMAHVPDKHSILFAPTVIDDGAPEAIRSYKNGSRAMHVPLDMFPYSDNGEES